ncbi:hypothetical protein CDD82_6403 [Ophiocordyceps australis]|uniref:Major facilitator superfamily (MFS) profile domain-containing protein n=1 Tax=Ophiocordyceps australis TaxID=1399860 RepID=A0A2C5YV49_9HYPO|nr:hypothetical protein CDD82_6403 [Ophiocordyceps australis]
MAWGIVTMCLGFVRGFASFVAVRAVLGLTEGGLLPGMVLYLSGLYTRGELALRIGLLYTAASLAGAFGAIGPRAGLQGWRWIFIIEGLMTVVAGAIAVALLPNSPSTAHYLTPAEREWASKRLAKHGSKDEPFRWSEVRRGIFNVQVWLSSTAYFAILSGLYSSSLFVPSRRNLAPASEAPFY